MLSKTKILLILIHFGHLHAQNGFYIKPDINLLKFHKNSNKVEDFNSKSGAKIEISTKNFYSTFPNLFFGCNFGYKTDNFFYEFGYYQDATSNYVGIKYQLYNTIDNNYFSAYNSSYVGIAQRSFPIRIGIKLFQNSSKTHLNRIFSLYLVAGIEAQFNYGTLQSQISEFAYTPNGIDNIKITLKTDPAYRRVYHPSIGFLFEIKNKNNFNLFNLNMNYNISNFQSKWLQSTNVLIEDIDGKKYYVGNFSSTGSGLDIGISKNIYFNRIFKKKKTIDR